MNSHACVSRNPLTSFVSGKGNLFPAISVYGKGEEHFRIMGRQFLIKTSVLAAVIAGLAAVALYATVGSEAALSATASGPASNPDKAASVDSLLSGLESRLAADPEDAKGWLLLARSYDHLGKTADAWGAYSRAQKLGLSDAAFELKLASALQPSANRN